MSAEPFFKKLTGLVNGVTIAVFCLMNAIAFIQVVARYVFSHALPWPEEACSYLFLCAAYFGMVLSMENNSHLRIDVLLAYMPPAWRKTLDRVAQLAAALFGLLICGLGAYMAWDVWDMEQMMVSFPLPVWVVVAVIPASALLLALYALRNFAAAGNKS